MAMGLTEGTGHGALASQVGVEQRRPPHTDAGSSSSGSGAGRRRRCSFPANVAAPSCIDMTPSGMMVKDRRPATAATMAMAAAAAVADEPRKMQSSVNNPVKRTAWLAGGLVLALVGARWGVQVGTTRRLDELEVRLKQLETQQHEWLRRQAETTPCITHVQRTSTGWQFLRIDGSEAGHIEVSVPASVDAEEVAGRRVSEVAGQCVVNITVGENTASLKVQRLSGETAELAMSRLLVDARQAADGTSGGKVTTNARRQNSAGAAEMIASELMHAPAHVLLPPSAPRPRSQATVSYPDLACRDVVNKEWLEVKSAAANEFSSWRAGVQLMDVVQLQVLVDSAVRRLSAKSNVDECGMGRLCMSMLAVIAGGTGGVLLGASTIHSPMLTILLDMPWHLVMVSGWPLFALLAQLQLRARARHTAPPEVGPAADYFRDLGRSLEQGETGRLAYLGAAFLRHEEGRAHASAFVIPGLCALASQLLSPEVGSSVMPIENALQQVQGFFRQAVQSVDDLQGTLDSPWPLYGVLHLAALQLS